jgi:hypothetical protein
MCLVLQSCVKEITLPDFGNTSIQPIKGNTTPLPTTTPKPTTSGCVNGRLQKSVQCSGTTKKGKRCGNMTLNCSGRCHLH